MNKKIYIFIILIAIAASLVAVWGKHVTERDADGVELIMDFRQLSRLEVDMDQYLSALRDNGLTAVGLYPDTLFQLVKDGDIRLLKANEVTRAVIRTGDINPELADFPFNKDSAFIIFDREFSDQLQQVLPAWSEEYDIDYSFDSDKIIIFFQEWEDEYINLSLGFNRELLAKIREKGIKIVPRIDDNSLSNEVNWQLMDDMSPYIVIFDGAEITGYKNDTKEELKKTAEIMNKNYIIFGMIEDFIAHQLGADSLAYFLDFNLLRAHSIQQAEMDYRDGYITDEIIDRYLRSVRERNVRLLYLKPFLEDRDEVEPQDLTLDFVKNLSAAVKTSGFKAGSVKTFSKYKSPVYLLLLTSLGIMIAGIYLLQLLFNIKFKKLSWVIIITGIVFEVLLLGIGKELFLRKLLALGSAVIFPAVAVITQLLSGQEKRWLIRFLKAGLISLTGAVFLSASLAHIAFILKVDQFAGVKLSYILPLLLILVYYINESNFSINTEWWQRIKDIMNLELKLKHLILLGVLGLIGYIYIGRTGNNFIIPILNIEAVARDLLENILHIRPRFKEFLIGHPFFILCLGLGGRYRGKLLYIPLIILAAVGQINILNTFSHIHTPFVVSLIRFFHGLWLGLLIGVLLLLAARYLLLLWKKKREKYHV